MANPYIDHTRLELYRAAQARAGELLESDADTAHLLLAMAMQLHVAHRASRGPDGGISGQSLHDAYRDRLALLMRNARYEVLRDAADAVLGQGAHQWLTAPAAGGSPYERAVAGNTGLAEVLAELEAMRK